MNTWVLLDNTVLTNFALLNRPDLVLDLWTGACTTTAVLAEYQAGTAVRPLPADCWQTLTLVDLTPEETAVAQQLAHHPGAGERTCIAVAHCRNGLFASDDADARRAAQMYGIPLTGTSGHPAAGCATKTRHVSGGQPIVSRAHPIGLSCAHHQSRRFLPDALTRHHFHETHHLHRHSAFERPSPSRRLLAIAAPPDVARF
jgi:predicted nucleic acid-binding protein